MVTKIIKDPVHGYIKVNEFETELIDSEQMQRLRTIKQNGFGYLIYPGLNNTRFEHSLGTMHIAGKIADQLRLKKGQKQTLKTAALLHDIGHGPFSHVSDFVFERFGSSHEENSIRIIQKTEIKQILEKYGENPDEVGNLILGNTKSLLKTLVSSEGDIDKLDYLVRDSYYAGVPYGRVDTDRVIANMRLEDGKVIVNENSITAVEALVIARKMMYEAVYYHKTNRIANAMFKSAVEKMIDQKHLDYKEFLSMDDISMVTKMRDEKGYAGDIWKLIEKRKLFKVAFQEKFDPLLRVFRKDVITNKRKVESQIAKEIHVKNGYVLIDFSRDSIPEFKIWTDSKYGLKKIDEVSHLAHLIKSTEDTNVNFWVYTPKSCIKKIDESHIRSYVQYTQKLLSNF